MTADGNAGHGLAPLAEAARRRRDLLAAWDEQIAERLDRPLRPGAPPSTDVHHAFGRAVLGVGQDLTIGNGLDAAFGHDWFPCEAWGAWSAAERALLSLALAPEVTLPAKLRLEFFTLVAGGQARRARLVSPARVLGAVEFSRPDIIAIEIEVAQADLGADRVLNLVVEVDGLVSPAQASGAPDDRQLGLGLTRVSLLLPAGEVLQGRLDFQRRRMIGVLRRARLRLRERGLARGAAHLLRMALRRLSQRFGNS